MNGKTDLTRAESFFRTVISYRLFVIGLFFCLVIWGGFHALRMETDARIEAFVPSDHHSLVSRQRIKEAFGLEDPFAILIVDDGPAGVFTPGTLALIRHISDEIRLIDGVDKARVTSLATVDNIYGTETELLVEPFFDEAPTTQAEADAIRDAVMRMGYYVGPLVSADGTATLVVFEIVDASRGPEIYARAQSVVSGLSPSPDARLLVAGTGAVTATLGAYIEGDVRRITPAGVVLITLILAAAFRTIAGAILPNIVALGTMTIALGIMAFRGVATNVITSTLPVILVALAVADGIHILAEFYKRQSLRPTEDKNEAIVKTCAVLWKPCTVTTLTDMGGFLALYGASWMPPMKAFALYGAVGMAAELALALMLLPALMSLVPLPPSPVFARPAGVVSARSVVNRISGAVAGRPRMVLALAGAIAAICVAGAGSLRIDDDRVQNFSADEPLYQADRLVNARLAGSNFLDVHVTARSGSDILAMENLNAIEKLQEFAVGLPRIEAALSVTSYLKEMNRAMQGNREESYAVPQDPELAAQYLLLGDGDEIGKRINYDRTQANIRFFVNVSSYREKAEFLPQLLGRLKQFEADTGMAVEVSGNTYVDYCWVGQVGRLHFVSTTISLVTIWALMAVSFGSIVAGGLAVLPVCAAILTIYGVMGFAGIWMGVSTSMFAAITLGIGVDFAIHSLDRLQRILATREEDNKGVLSALYESTGWALVVSGACVAFGFGILIISNVPSLRWFGGIIMVGVATSFIVSVTVLPALVQVTKPKVFYDKARRTDGERALG